MLRGIVVCLAACGPAYSKLEVDKIKSVAVALDDPAQSFCAYTPTAVRAIVTYNDGKQARSRLPDEDEHGHLRTTEFAWTSNHGVVTDAAVLTLNDDPLVWYDSAIQVSAHVVAKPELGGDGTLHPRFDCGGTVDLRGAEGARGGEAEDGGPGAAGPAVDVALAYLTAHDGRVVLVRVQRESDAPSYFVIGASEQKPFVLDVRGGDGGRGGQGVSGFDGRAGIDGQPGWDADRCADGGPGGNGSDGEPGGSGGDGANGGRGGDGGRVTLHYDARFPELASVVTVNVGGGAPGVAGKGGDGGRGGNGGNGGRGGNVPSGCPAKSGLAGSSGARGLDGPQGRDGTAGTSGAPGSVVASPADVTQLFAPELARSLPIAGAS